MKYIDEMLEALKIANEEMKKNNLKKIIMHNLRVNCTKSYNGIHYYKDDGFYCKLVKDNGKKFKVVLNVKYDLNNNFFDGYNAKMIIEELSNGGTNKVTVKFGKITVKGKHVNIVC